MIRVVFLAQLREQLGTAALEVPAKDIGNIFALKAHLLAQNPSWQTALSNSRLMVAVNHAYVKGDSPLADGDEVAFFPPVTGG